MLRFEYIPREWIASPRARLVYRAAAIASLALFPLLMAVQLPSALRPLLRLLVFFGILGTALTLVGMEYFLLRLDTSPALKQAFWFCALFFVPIGPALYCFFVYSHSHIVKSGGAERHPDRT